jgi:hypothetical protein
MALFTDLDIVTLDDLLRFETTLVQIASSHGINVQTKIRLSVEAIGDRILLWLLKVRGSDPQSINRRSLGLSTVVVTPTLHRWLCYDCLARFFAEAYNVQLNTRFQGKWNEYLKQANDAADMVFTSGLGIVRNALPKPAMPLVSVQDGLFLAQALFVQTAWVDESGNEGTLSPVNALILPDSSTISVSMEEGAIAVPSNAAGWNVYAGATDQSLTLQNDSPLVIGSTWEIPPSGLIDGRAPINGQPPDIHVDLSRQIQRG